MTIPSGVLRALSSYASVHVKHFYGNDDYLSIQRLSTAISNVKVVPEIGKKQNNNKKNMGIYLCRGS